MGLALWLGGTLTNLYHHYLLAGLRKGGDDTRYVRPTGGLFELCVCPHYFGEIVGWLGVVRGLS